MLKKSRVISGNFENLPKKVLFKNIHVIDNSEKLNGKKSVVIQNGKIGDILEILLDEGEPVRNAPASFAEQGQEVLEVKNVEDYYCVKVRRKK